MTRKELVEQAFEKIAIGTKNNDFWQSGFLRKP